MTAPLEPKANHAREQVLNDQPTAKLGTEPAISTPQPLNLAPFRALCSYSCNVLSHNLASKLHVSTGGPCVGIGERNAQYQLVQYLHNPKTPCRPRSRSTSILCKSTGRNTRYAFRRIRSSSMTTGPGWSFLQIATNSP
ncbi:hypothetical protein BS47DRAFT_1343740 [Hydnum rufescens UP504]|uniref:Uncharacterized protein n=1 Tax=Hydnum rufescens UP504 TaxID=1448309 RepID=A0A9P6AXP1_9AGAM|nr:hypothetical protein BS47DRAFT_1343740 [Hydnum rufescens UP504]